MGRYQDATGSSPLGLVMGEGGNEHAEGHQGTAHIIMARMRRTDDR